MPAFPWERPAGWSAPAQLEEHDATLDAAADLPGLPVVRLEKRAAWASSAWRAVAPRVTLCEVWSTVAEDGRREPLRRPADTRRRRVDLNPSPSPATRRPSATRRSPPRRAEVSSTPLLGARAASIIPRSQASTSAWSDLS